MLDVSDEDLAVRIIGIGGQTPIGRTAASSMAAARSGFADFTAHPYLIDCAGKRMIVSRARWLPRDLSVADRLLALALPAATQSLRALVDRDVPRSTRIAVTLAVPPPRPGLAEATLPRVLGGLIDALRDDLSELGLRLEETALIASGHAAGLMALEMGWRRIASGEIDLCLVGGADSYQAPETLHWLEEHDQLHTRSNRWGFIPGEGAGFCLLAGRAITARIGASSLCAIVSAATCRETKLIKTRTVCTGEGLTAAFKAALGALPPGILVDHIVCDLNGEPYRANEFAFSLVRAKRRLCDPGSFRAPADCWGDVGAASGPLFVALAVEAANRGYARGPLSLLCASSEPGERSATVLYAKPSPREV